ncbi:MAG: hypothetical protein WA211_18690 [Candidatus Acidiferrales bacterium]
MTRTKAKRGTKKPARMEKGKALKPVKPLQEAVTFTYGKLAVDYKPQSAN